MNFDRTLLALFWQNNIFDRTFRKFGVWQNSKWWNVLSKKCNFSRFLSYLFKRISILKKTTFVLWNFIWPPNVKSVSWRRPAAMLVAVNKCSYLSQTLTWSLRHFRIFFSIPRWLKLKINHKDYKHHLWMNYYKIG